VAGVQLCGRRARGPRLSDLDRALSGDEDLEQLEDHELSLVELVDHVLNKGVVLAGEATIAVADVDLIYLGLNIVLTSVETARNALQKRQ
jgi:hypothetical protein